MRSESDTNLRAARAALFACALVFATGCATYQPQSFWEVSRTRADIESNNFRMQQARAMGTATASYLFPDLGNTIASVLPYVPAPPPGQVSGIPLTDTAVLEKAMRALHKEIDGEALGKSVFLHNISVEWTNDRVLFFLYGDYTVTITADVYEYTDEYTDYRNRP